MNYSEIKILNVTAENVAEAGIYCIKDKKAPGYKSKISWFQSKINDGLRIKIAIDETGKQVGFVEYIPSELAWRPIQADNFLFIQCIALFVKDAKEKGIGSLLLEACAQDAKAAQKSGLCAMSSDGVWIANKNLYEKNGFEIADKLGRFELMVKDFGNAKTKPRLIDWTKQQAQYQGWNLVYSDQCPWHEKAIVELKVCAIEHGIELKIKKINTPQEAQLAPSGFGTFSLLKDGKLLEDHYISRTRFENIIKAVNK